VTPGIEGKLYGGATPISGATIAIWETDATSAGYPSSSAKGAAKSLISTTTGSDGSFKFTKGFTCDAPATGTAGPFLYLVGTGGNTGAGINSNTVLVSALGSCAYLNGTVAASSLKVKVNEATTVAAAYALGNFMYVDNTGVYIGAPVNNNAVTGACTGTGSAMTCTAAGLSHAFNNAFNLVDAIHFDGTAPGGSARTTIVANPIVGTPANTLASVPQAEIHMLANVLSSCVNSAGGSAPGGTSDGSNCGNLFALAKSTSGTSPSDTTTAAINIAQNPTVGVAAIYALVAASSAPFAPTLSTAPADFAVTIAYTGTSKGAFGYPQYVTLDANDNVYVATADAATATVGGQAAMTSNGSGLWTNANTSTFCLPGTMATDTNGYVWETVVSASSGACPYGVYGFNTTTGASAYSFTQGSTDATHAIQSAPLGVAFDRNNNLWYVRKSSSCTQCLFQLPFTAGTGGTAGTYGAPLFTQNSIVNVGQIVIDSKANLYMANLATSGTKGITYVLPNSGTASAPSYGATPAYLKYTLPASGSGSVAVDAAGIDWAGSAAFISKITPTSTSGVITSISATDIAVASTNSSATTPSKPYPGMFDGNGVLWYPSYTTAGQLWFTRTASNVSDYIYTCYAPNGAATCSTNGTTTNNTRDLQIDSSGAIWGAGVTNGYVIQILGAAAPAWPQLSYGVFASKPQ
jgi:hypothetical protein